MNNKKFQLDFSSVPLELRPVIFEKVVSVLLKNGFKNGMDRTGFICGKSKADYLVIGYHHDYLDYNFNPFLPEDFTVYNVISDWDTWTKIKFKKEFEPIVVSPRVKVTDKWVDFGDFQFGFDIIERIHQAVQEAKEFQRNNS